MYPWMDSFWGFPSTDQFRNSNLTDPITSFCCRISRSVTYVAHLSAMCKNAFTAILLCYLTCFYTPLTFILQPHFELMDVVSYEWRWRRRGRFIYQLSLTYATRSVGPGRWPGKHQQWPGSRRVKPLRTNFLFNRAQPVKPATTGLLSIED